MAHSEACQIFIEEQIKEGLAQGKNPHSIGKELTKMIEKMFEASIPAETIRSRARFIQKKGGEITSPNITPANSSENRENQVKQHGGAREGAGRPGKYEDSLHPSKTGSQPKQERQLPSQTMELADQAISHLSQIKDDDPAREEALQKVINWAERFKNKNLAVKPFTIPLQFARLAIQQLERIDPGHTERKAAMKYVIKWINNNL
jgi:hypothetical protein